MGKSSGDQVLEWNGVFLTGKTFEEVERIVNSSSGEVEVVVRTGEPEYTQTGEFDIRTASPERRPPVPMHKKQNTRIYDNVETLNTRRTVRRIEKLTGKEFRLTLTWDSSK